MCSAEAETPKTTMIKKCTALAAVAMSITITASAVPAKRENTVVMQPDGTTITIHKVGDENIHFTLTDDDKLLTIDENGQYCYANLDEHGNILSTGIKAHNAAERPDTDAIHTKALKDIDVEQLMMSRQDSRPRRAIAQSGLGTYTSNFPKKGIVKGLIILVQYSDVKFKQTYSVSAKQYFTDMMSKEGFSEYNATGSAADYFKTCSNGQFKPQFDVVGPVTLSNTRAYYGANNSKGNDSRPGEMIKEACELVDSSVNFADYDNDKDGYCDNVYVIYAGFGEASSNDSNAADAIWPHSWTISEAMGLDDNSKLKLDGVYVDRYACSNEWQATTSLPDGIGTFVHEFSHVMGLPDLYSTSGTTLYCTPCEYSVMDYGTYNNNSRTPPTYSSFERNAMGWIEPTQLGDAQNIALKNLADSNEACIIPTSKDTEFYLLENRQQTGWDKYIPGHGLIIWHIDFDQSVWDDNIVNNNKSHQYVDIVEANNNNDGSSLTTMAGWTWPGTSEKTEFTDDSTPALKDWSGNKIDVPITNILEESNVITFRVSGGAPIDIPVIDNENSIVRGSNYFVASWSPVENAVNYKIWVYAVDDANIDGDTPTRESQEREVETADMGTSTSCITLPEGWSATSTKNIYKVAASSGNAIPSAKLVNDAYIQTREYDNDVVKISFWMKGLATSTSTILQIDGKINGVWKTITTITPPINRTTSITLKDVPKGVKQVRFTHIKDKGNIAIDDITITSEGGVEDEVLTYYNGLTTGGKTQVRVDKLKANKQYYKFAVAASPDNIGYSDLSDFAYVKIGTTGVESISTDNDNNTLLAHVDGNTVTVTTQAQQVEIYNTLGQKIASKSTVDGCAEFVLASNQMYIIHANDKSLKIVVR